MTGAWFGRFSYLGGGEPDVSFIASIEELFGMISGTTSEPNTVGDTTMHLNAVLRGSRDGEDVRFTKLYDGESDAAHGVDYAGTISTDGTRVTGFWSLAGLSGGFEMNRTHAEAVEEKQLEVAVESAEEQARTF
ncbi:hypothetical protein ABC347_04900 [Sphingomonas sp. 1P06PA]|uniref:hypothetical protein n=1 Tax=Sphingomonas sp. 1P06PA TaxID=554121 RepID=UPI0039A667DB